MKSFYLTLLCFALCLFTFHVYATTYYVSPLGDNNNSGTSIDSAWKTITKINLSTFNGDTILFEGGAAFTGRMGFGSTDIGTSTEPIVIGSYGNGRATIYSDTSYGISVYNTAGFKIQNLIFQGSGSTTNKQAGILVYLDIDSTQLPYIKIDNVEVFGYGNSGISIGSWSKGSGYSDVSVTNSLSHDNGGRAGIFMYTQNSYVHKNVYIGYNKSYNNPGTPTDTSTNTGSGILLIGVDGCVIEYCSSYNNGASHLNSKGGPVGIWAYQSNNVVIQFNESHHNKSGTTLDGGGFDFDGGTTNSILQYNYSHDNNGPGFMLFEFKGAPVMKNNIVRYNISENDVRRNTNGRYGSMYIGQATTDATRMQGIEIYNNTIYLDPGTNTSAVAFTYKKGTFTGVNVRNNIFVTTKGAKLVNIYKTSGINFQGNCYWSSGASFKITKADTILYTSLSAFRSSTNKEKINGVSCGVSANPKFLDSIRGVTFNDATQLSNLRTYKLQSSSTLIKKGKNLNKLFGLNVGLRDFWGNDITTDTLYNIGAYDVIPPLSRSLLLSDESEERQASEINLHVFPNPFTTEVKIGFSLKTSERLNVALFNFEGKLIRSLYSGNLDAGQYKDIILNAKGLAAGAYIIRMANEEKVLLQRILIKQ